uniref:Uncharacterized protein n=1 Tax=Acrobeloides nanus TaxID=290746 RepID=A0A914DAK3_9BILA
MELLMHAYARKCRLPSRSLLFYVDDSIIIQPEHTPASLNLRPSNVINVYETVYDLFEDEAAPPVPPAVQNSNHITSSNHAPAPSAASAPELKAKIPAPEPEPEPEPSQISATKASFIVRDIYDRHFVAKVPLAK